MSLKDYYNKAVIIYGNNGERIVGIVDDYVYPEDNESGVESIIIKTNSGYYEVVAEDINEIEIL